MLLSVSPIFAPLQPEKIIFAAVFIYVYCVRVPYIQGKRLKRFYLPFAAVFMYDRQKVLTLSFESVCSRLFDMFHLSRLILNKVLCLNFDVFSRFMLCFLIQINSKLKTFGNFVFFSIFATNILSFYFSVSRFFIRFDYSEKNENRNEKAVFLPFLPENVRFCRKYNVYFQRFMGIQGKLHPNPRF